MPDPEWLDGLAAIAWPILGFVLLWRLAPLLEGAIRRGTLKVRFGDVELSVQEASEGLRKQIEDLQQQVLELQALHGAGAAPPGEGEAAAPDRPRPADEPRTILWADDRPQSIAVEIATLEDWGVRTVQVPTTADALRELRAHGADYAALITDMARVEHGVKRPKAGLELIAEARRLLPDLPIFMYCGAKNARLRREEVLGHGANGITSSPVELFQMIQAHVVGAPHPR